MIVPNEVVAHIIGKGSSTLHVVVPLGFKLDYYGNYRPRI